MSLREVAEEVRAWATANHMMAIAPPSVGGSIGRAEELFRNVGIAAAVDTLQHRRISFIGYDDQENKLIVFTDKKLSKKEHKSLERAVLRSADTSSDISVRFLHSGVATAGAPPATPIVPPYVLHNDKYPCGTSISIGSEKSAGTFGCLVQNAQGKKFGLSNNHVVGGCNYAPFKTPILAPGVADVSAGGANPFTIGKHAACYPFVDGIPSIVAADGNIDAALFEIENESLVSSMQRSYFDTPTSFSAIQVGMNVQKVGRTTGLTSGRVVAKASGFEGIHYSISAFGGLKLAFFQDLYMIQGSVGLFSTYGDSGSVVVSQDRAGARSIVGLIVGITSQGLALVHCITRILPFFSVTPVSGHNI